ncbi:TPA_asm: nucleoprotein [Sphaeridiorhabdovirus 3]|nr:TPA_asm: nucleoprotein [Sphaeridiorhabdovirus 3]
MARKGLSRYSLSGLSAVHPETREPAQLASTIGHTARLPTYYSEELPKEKITLKYYAKDNWNLKEAAGTVLDMLRGGMLPSKEIQLYFLVEYFKTKKYTAIEDIQVGQYNVKQNDPLPTNLFVEFVQDLNATSTMSNVQAPEVCYEGLAAWILFQSRIRKFINDRIKKQYVDNLLRTLKNLSLLPPFNLTSMDIANFPSDCIPFLATASDSQISFMAALFDYYAVACVEEKHKSIRFATLATRHHDEIALVLIENIVTGGIVTGKEFAQMMITPGMANDCIRVMLEGQGTQNPFSLTPYARSMNLVTKSMYSLSENPFLCTFASVLLACAGNPNQLLISKTTFMVDYEITIAIKLYMYIGGSREIGAYIIDKTKAKQPDYVVKAKSAAAGHADFEDIRGRIIKEVKEQTGLPTEKELSMLKEKIKNVPKREGTLCEYIRSMPYWEPRPAAPDSPCAKRCRRFFESQSQETDDDRSDSEMTSISKNYEL